jgi:hypothetical protein
MFGSARAVKSWEGCYYVRHKTASSAPAADVAGLEVIMPEGNFAR